MKRRLVLTALLLWLAVPAMAQSNRVTIASYNIENAFDVFDDPYTKDEDSEVKQRAAWEAIAGAVKALDPDVMGIVELENEHLLKAMVSEFLPEAGYQYIAADVTNSDRGINLGIISRLPILSATSYRFRTFSIPGTGAEATAGAAPTPERLPQGRTDDPRSETVGLVGPGEWTFARDLWQVTVQTPDGRPLDIFIVHLKSKADSDGDPNSDTWRLAEATEARRIIDALLAEHPDRRLAICGDFNDTPGSPPIQALLAGGELIDCHASLPEESRITYLRKPYRSTVDYILTSPALARCLVPTSSRVLDDESLLKGSDHAPICATFELTN